MRYAYVGFLIVFCASAGAEPAVTFPGPVTEVRAPSSDTRVTYFDPGENQYQVHEYSLRLIYPDGRSDEVGVFTRSVDVAWSPSGAAFYYTDLVGANVSDCYVIVPGPATQKISLTEVVTQGRFPAPAWTLQHSSRGYVKCEGWAEADKLRFVVEGAGEEAPNGFHYAFEYDVGRGIAKQVPTKAKKTPKRKR